MRWRWLAASALMVALIGVAEARVGGAKASPEGAEAGTAARST